MSRTKGKRKSESRQTSHELEPTPEQKRWHEQYRRAQEGYERFRNWFFGFWESCPTKRCRRVRACAGDTQECFQRNWPTVPEDSKQWYRALGKAIGQGHSRREAGRIADAELERWKEYMARVSATLGAHAAASRATPEPTAPAGVLPGPRARTL